MRRKRILWSLALAVVASAGIGWLSRDRILAEYYVYRLSRVAEADVGAWVADSGAWGPAVEPVLLAELASDDGPRCERAGAALAQLHLGESETFVALLAAKFESLGPAGQDWALQQVGARDSDPATLETCRQLLVRAVQNPAASIRHRVIGLALKFDAGSLEFLAPLVNDSDAEVRRAAVLALGAHREWLSDDDLLPRLHDPEREVQRLARMALRSRGLTEDQVRMGRMLTDSRPASRLDLVSLLRDDTELDLRMWLLRLSRDPSPAVRAAAVRSASELRIFQLTDRLSEMAESDPDDTVRPIAQFHLKQIRLGQAIEDGRANSP